MDIYIYIDSLQKCYADLKHFVGNIHLVQKKMAVFFNMPRLYIHSFIKNGSIIFVSLSVLNSAYIFSSHKKKEETSTMY